MALTISEKFRTTVGGKQMRFLYVTDDEATSTFSAASLDLTWVEWAGQMGLNYSSDVANTSILAHHFVASALGLSVEMGVPANAATIKKYLVIGW